MTEQVKWSLEHLDNLGKWMGVWYWELSKYGKDAEAIVDVFNKCQSKLEAMYLFGALAQIGIDTHPHKRDDRLYRYEFEYRGELVTGIWVPEPWTIFEANGCDGGPSSMTIVPQAPFGPRYHHDFLIFSDNDNGSGGGQPWFAVEVDGTKWHQGHEKKDAYRDSLCSYPVLRLRQEHESPSMWTYKLLWRLATIQQDWHDGLRDGPYPSIQEAIAEWAA